VTKVTQSSHGRSDPARKPTVRAAALILADARLLLVRQHRQAGSYWLLPGGGVRFGESVAEAVTRELAEELGLDIDAGDPVALVESISDDMNGYPKHVVHVIVSARLAGQAQSVRLGGDPAILEARFFTRQDVTSLTVAPPIGDFLDTCFEQPSGVRGRMPMTYLGVRW
jgi:8-oxo-dGTP diphosphatase